MSKRQGPDSSRSPEPRRGAGGDAPKKLSGKGGWSLLSGWTKSGGAQALAQSEAASKAKEQPGNRYKGVTRSTSFTSQMREVSLEQPASAKKKQFFGKGPFPTHQGYVTENARMYWCEERLGTFEGVPEELDAVTDYEKPLYHWQLFSVLGEARILALVTAFYDYVYSDPNAWFRKAFTEATSKEMAIFSQSTFWLDAFGGGMKYPGGYHRSRNKHGFIKEHMTTKAAVRWIELMRLTLDNADLGPDPRVRGVLEDFVEVHMLKYASQFGFDPSCLRVTGHGPGNPYDPGSFQQGGDGNIPPEFL
eukprot:CAMPEP_0173431114 /NCGR_PEP_ID=MMETSP1357-20121228/9347_1 /TAXON_ID=77926 /ORGANISM="Hemiselmis rufescens, Strain PCC563" /LENGTH=304 /DNA_ID=CAMNT_0014395553 /DNA_START=34 /DNA_END=948 /DNA_ORIENTATION=-